MKLDLQPDVRTVFHTQLGWLAVGWIGEKVHQLSFGHRREVLAVDRLHLQPLPLSQLTKTQQELVERWKNYAPGGGDDFCDVPVQLGRTTRFQDSVYRHGRKVPLGETISYQALARRAGPPAGRSSGRQRNGVQSDPAGHLLPPHGRCPRRWRRRLFGFRRPKMKRRLLALEGSTD